MNKIRIAALITSLLMPCWALAASTVLKESDLYLAKRQAQYFVVELKQPHRVYSTSKNNGGEQSEIRFLVNHQSMEARNHLERAELILSDKGDDYHQALAKTLAIDASRMVLMGTAANMGNIAHSNAEFKDLHVDVFATAGVSGNALRAGDPTNWYQTKDGNRSIDYDGTINIIVLINQPLSAGAQAKVATIMTEAKSAALSELSIPSKKSQHLATGTGTDQFIIATPVIPGAYERSSASGHLKIGELVGQAVRQAVLNSLQWQNRLSAKSIASVTHALGRFGFSKAKMLDHFKQMLSNKSAELADHNFHAINHDPRLVASAYAYAQILDRIEYGSLSELVVPEVLKDHALIAATALSARPDYYHRFWKGLNYDGEPINLFMSAAALGWQAKWE